jgi:hypothetical protein
MSQQPGPVVRRLMQRVQQQQLGVQPIQPLLLQACQCLGDGGETVAVGWCGHERADLNQKWAEAVKRHHASAGVCYLSFQIILLTS